MSMYLTKDRNKEEDCASGWHQPPLKGLLNSGHIIRKGAGNKQEPASQPKPNKEPTNK